MRVRDLDAERNALIAELALSHPLHLLAVAYFHAFCRHNWYHNRKVLKMQVKFSKKHKLFSTARQGGVSGPPLLRRIPPQRRGPGLPLHRAGHRVPALQKSSVLQGKRGEGGEAPAHPCLQKEHQPGVGGGPLQGQRRDGADEKGADQVDGERPDGKAPIPSQRYLPRQIRHTAPRNPPSPTAIQFSMDATPRFILPAEKPAASMVTQPEAGGKSPPRSGRPAGFGRGHGARTGKPAAGCCASGEIHI